MNMGVAPNAPVEDQKPIPRVDRPRHHRRRARLPLRVDATQHLRRLNYDGYTDTRDLVAFLNEWVAGC
jgi:hypothetical protein